MAPAAKHKPLFDSDLAELPADARWREWMGRVEAAIFVSPDPVPRERLAPLVGPDCKLDELIADIRSELRGRPYDLVFVAGGWHHRTRARFADAVDNGVHGEAGKGPTALNDSELLVLATIAYQQPITRGELSAAIGREISRDLIARLRQLDLIAAGPRAPTPGAPPAYITTAGFLSMFNLGGLRDLPDVEEMEDAGLLGKEKLMADDIPPVAETTSADDDDMV